MSVFQNQNMVDKLVGINKCLCAGQLLMLFMYCILPKVTLTEESSGYIFDLIGGLSQKCAFSIFNYDHINIRISNMFCFDSVQVCIRERITVLCHDCLSCVEREHTYRQYISTQLHIKDISGRYVRCLTHYMSLSQSDICFVVTDIHFFWLPTLHKCHNQHAKCVSYTVLKSVVWNTGMLHITKHLKHQETLPNMPETVSYIINRKCPFGYRPNARGISSLKHENNTLFGQCTQSKSGRSK